jgi:uroporphyrin-III C-methyltransferase
MQPEPRGKVLQVGAGPGAADLLTLRAVRAIASASVVLHDALIGEDVLALIPPATRRIEVGKRGHRSSASQDFINRLMASLALSGQRVVRLKGGDPSIFGRAGEERAFLEQAGVSVEVIPGITTASAAAAQFSFSLTTRAQTRRVLFATGRTLEGAAGDWQVAADSQTTLCLYMGCADIAFIAAELIALGRDASTPAIAAIDVERSGARLIRTTLASLPAELAGQELDGPVFITVGEAVATARDSVQSDALQLPQDRSAYSR